MTFWFKNKYDDRGVYVGRLVVQAINKKEANRRMFRIESHWNDGLHLGNKIHGPHETREKAETVLS